MRYRVTALAALLAAGLLAACQNEPYEPEAPSAHDAPSPQFAAAFVAPATLGNRCGHQLTGVAWDGTYYYVAEGQFGLNNCIIRYTAAGEYVDQLVVAIDMRGLHYVPATGKLLTRRYNGGIMAVDYGSGQVVNLTPGFQPAPEQYAPAPDPEGGTFWVINGSVAEQHRLSDNGILTSFPITTNDPYVIGASVRWIYTVEGTTVHIYSKHTGRQLATRTLAGALGCQGWGFGASSSGDRVLYVRTCDGATAEATGLGGKGLTSSCGHQLTGVAWDGTYYYAAEGQFGATNCISRFTADSEYVDLRVVQIDMRGLHYVPATGKLVTRIYNNNMLAVDYPTGSVSQLTTGSTGPEQYAPAPDPEGGTYWIIDGSSAEQHRLNDRALVRTIAVIQSDPYAIGVSVKWVFTVSGSTIHIYSKLTGFEVATRTLAGSLGCQGWGLGASASGDRVLYVRTCNGASAELTGLGGKGLASTCGRQLTGVAWDGTYYYVAEGQFSANNCITRYTAESTYVDQRLIGVDMRGLHYVPATGKLVTRIYNNYLVAVDYPSGGASPLSTFSGGIEQYAPAPDPAGGTFWVVNGSNVEQHRLNDNAVVRSFGVTTTNPYSIGVTDNSVLTLEGNTVHVYDKATGIHLGRRTLAGTLGCQGWGFGAGAAGDRILYVRTCALASAEAVSLPAPGSTPPGSNVSVEPLDVTTGEPSPVELSFATVSGGGVTTVESGTLGESGSPPAPGGYRLSEGLAYYDITTTATFSGTVTVCFTYSPAGILNESGLRLLHGNGDGTWTDVTTSLDQSSHRICGEVTSLSPFLVVEPKLGQTVTFGPLPDVFLDAPSFQIPGTASSGLPVSFALGTGSAGCALVGSTVTITGVTASSDACIVVASQAGNGDYLGADPVARSFHVRYRFAGFFQPVENPGPAAPYLVNRVSAGRAIPVKFGLSGNQGLEIFEAGSPKSAVSSACSGGTTDEIEQTVTATVSGLTYDPVLDQYTYVWKTGASWGGQCRKLTVTLLDGTAHEALFRFGK